MDTVDAIVIGAGVVGLAVARALARQGREVLILEAESRLGTVTSARNSGVIHAGLYYRPGSLKAQYCVVGREMLYAYAKEHGVTHKQCGKLVVATEPDQIEALNRLHANGEKNGVIGIERLSAEDARRIEPELTCLAALHVWQSGIIDTHELVLALLSDAEAGGAKLVLKTPVLGGAVANGRIFVNVGGTAPIQIGCRTLVNAAGLVAQDVARNIRGVDPRTIPPQVLAKGSYFSLSGKAPFTRLIYPLPTPGGSGLHFARDLSGRARFGPDVEWVERVDYHVNPERAAMFESMICRYWPGLPPGMLQPDYAGVRPKLGRTGPGDSDFMIQTKHMHGIPGLINLFGIESPGLTACMALGEAVASLAIDA